jgi:hypothetical protein
MVEGKRKVHFEEDWLVTEFEFVHFLNISRPINQFPCLAHLTKPQAGYKALADSIVAMLSLRTKLNLNLKLI